MYYQDMYIQMVDSLWYLSIHVRTFLKWLSTNGFFPKDGKDYF